MSFEVIAIPRFKHDLKKLAKKYPSLKSEYTALIEELEKSPRHGSALGNNCYKIRLAIASKARGKSGGARVITHVHVTKTSVYLLTIYDKSKRETIQDKELKMLLSEIPD